jgi:hypothetical protein
MTKIVFSEWVRWSDRKLLKGIEKPGIYLLAHFKSVPRGKAKPLSKRIIYIGESCSSLRHRWYQFERAAFEAKGGHSGGSTYRKKFGGKGTNLYVAASPVDGLGEELRPFFIRYAERNLIWKFVSKYSAPPKCNRK